MKLFQHIIISLLIIVVSFFIVLGWSHTSPHWPEIIQFLMGNSLDETDQYILFQMRLPRICLAFMVGMALSLAGLVLQNLFRNPLVDPFVIGVSGGGALGAGMAILFNFQFMWLGVSSLPFCAFLTALLTMRIVYVLGSVKGRIYIDRLLLAGVALSALSSALLSLLLVIKGKGMEAVVYWIMGSLAGRTWEEVLILLPFLLVASGMVIFCLKGLHVYQLGEEATIQLGIDVERLKIWVIISATLLSAAVVSVSGVIGFIGLIVPHMTRYLYRSTDIRTIFIPNMFLGGGLLVIADGFARNLLTFQEIPVGIFTALLGVPFFLYLLLNQRT